MSAYFQIRAADAPWGDYGAILLNGLAEPAYDDGRLTRLSLYRTGPFVPPITLPFGQVVLVDDLRRKLEATTFTGFDFLEVELMKVVRSDWHTWDQNADEPARYPASGEPEDYVLRGRHDTVLAEELPTLWALKVQSTDRLQVEGSSTFYQNRHPGTDVARAFLVFWVSEAMKEWLEEHGGRWVRFSPVVPR